MGLFEKMGNMLAGSIATAERPSGQSDGPDEPTSPFDSIREFDEDGNEFWSARKMMPFLGYKSWQSFEAVIKKAADAVANSGHEPGDHFMRVHEMVPVGSGAHRAVDDVRLDRFACYHLALAGDPTKTGVADARSYFVKEARENEVRKAEARRAKRLGPTAARAMKRNGLGLAWGEDRQDHCDKNRMVVGLLWKLVKEDAEKRGREPNKQLIAALHDALTEGATWMNTAQCLLALGIEKKKKTTPLDYLDSLPLATRNHMLTALIEGFKSGEITLQNAATKFEAIKRAARAIPGAVYGSDFRCVVDRDKADVPLLTYRSAIEDQRRRYCAQ